MYQGVLITLLCLTVKKDCLNICLVDDLWILTPLLHKTINQGHLSNRSHHFVGWQVVLPESELEEETPTLSSTFQVVLVMTDDDVQTSPVKSEEMDEKMVKEEGDEDEEENESEDSESSSSSLSDDDETVGAKAEEKEDKKEEALTKEEEQETMPLEEARVGKNGSEQRV